jgi:hypothetical protein
MRNSKNAKVMLVIKALLRAGVLQTQQKQDLARTIQLLNHALQIQDFKQLKKAIAQLSKIIMNCCS